MKSLLLLLISLIYLNPSLIWLNDLDTAKADAKASSKQILLVFSGSDWCKPCMQLKSNVFESDAFKAHAKNSLVLVNVDFKRSPSKEDKERLSYNESLAERYNPNGIFPFVLLLDAEGTIVKTMDGYQGETPDYYINEYLK